MKPLKFPDDMKQRDRVFWQLRSGWCPPYVLAQVATQYQARLKELRELGHSIEQRKVGRGYEYRIIGESLPQPQGKQQTLFDN